MAGLPWQIITTAVLAMTMLPPSIGISIDLHVPDSPVSEGVNITIQCTVKEKSSYQVSIQRLDEETSSNELLVFKDKKASLFPDNIVFDVSDEDDTFVFSLTINVVREDAQQYTCRAELGDDMLSDSGRLVVNYLPDVMYPICEIESTNKDLMQTTGSEVVLDCTTEIGNPPVDLRWTRTSQAGNDLVSSIDSTDDTLLTARVIVTLQTQDDDAIFTCSFAKDLARSCNIGPFQVSGSDKEFAKANYDPTMVVAIAVLAIVIAIVIVAVVIALLIKWGRCSCNNCDNRNHERDDVDSGQIEMQVSSKKAKKRTKKHDERLRYEVAAPMPISAEIPNDQVYSTELPKDTTSNNVPTVPPSKQYPPPPSYPSEEQEIRPDDEDVAEVDEIRVSTENFSQDLSISLTDSAVPPEEDDQQPAESESIDFVEDVTIE